MSKSLGNVIWAKDMIAKIGANVLRWVMLSAHYRGPLNINEEAIATASKELERISKSMTQAYVKAGLAGVELQGDAFLKPISSSTRRCVKKRWTLHGSAA